VRHGSIGFAYTERRAVGWLKRIAGQCVYYDKRRRYTLGRSSFCGKNQLIDEIVVGVM